ncbi:hypothetical protein GGTG_13865 [Gaeumannomyces tritici R3-111a-1]|uniref:Uncharacterized protein n=1 Tax=Gaeumannomyces tritici (strain R3-111a-1) TaxID=644352 RepID=J3PK19_GAET3|nr:hypothetical protein GGTG_13865 [Gaeumannomyces tritici R3-111a-1]EJT68560.1 hypothetical protein GGTG_13865 [Gaeumannomyces tritici R3-111a-1]
MLPTCPAKHAHAKIKVSSVSTLDGVANASMWAEEIQGGGGGGGGWLGVGGQSEDPDPDLGPHSSVGARM